MQLNQCLESVAQHLESLPEGLKLQEIEVLPYFAKVQGTIAEIDVEMHSKRYQGNGFEHLSIATMNTLAGTPMSVTVVLMPESDRGWPILGLDYVGFRGTLSLAAFDLFPCDQKLWETECKTQLQKMKEQSQNLIQRKTPDFAQDVFSSEAFFCAAKDSEQLRLASDLVKQLVVLYQEITQKPELSGSSNFQDSIEKWKHAMRSNKKEHSALSRIFGSDFTNAYLSEFLFA